MGAIFTNKDPFFRPESFFDLNFPLPITHYFVIKFAITHYSLLDGPFVQPLPITPLLAAHQSSQPARVHYPLRSNGGV